MKDLPKLHFPSIFIHQCAALERFPFVTFFWKIILLSRQELKGFWCLEKNCTLLELILIEKKDRKNIFLHCILFFFSDIPMLQLTIDMNMFNWQNNFVFMNLILLLQPLEKVKIYILRSEKLLFSIRICIFI